MREFAGKLKVLIPAAGAGTRLYPHTHTKPKAMIYVAGKPIIGHILDRLAGMDVRELILIVGYMRESLISYVRKNYRKKFKKISFITQEEQLGLGHAVYMARERAGNSPLLITLGDMIFKGGYESFIRSHLENNSFCSIGVKKVEKPQHYGIVYLSNGRIKRMVEKPKRPKSRLAIAGVYILNDGSTLMEALQRIVRKKLKPGEEYQLTDAFQLLMKEGMKTFEVFEWYDCGRTDTLLEANKRLLAEYSPKIPDFKKAVMIPPVSVGKNVKLIHSVIGPNVSISDSTTIRDSIIQDSIVGSNSSIFRMELSSSVIGDNVRISGRPNSLNIGDSSVIEF